VRLVIREHRALRLRCPRCEQVSGSALPAQVSGRAQNGPRLRAFTVYLVEQQLIAYARMRELLADLFGAHASVGTLLRWVGQAAAALVLVEVYRSPPNAEIAEPAG
jgi:hypothetical protein